LTKVKLFAVSAKEELEDVLSLRMNANKKFNLLVQYFGEDCNKPDEFFGIFATLLHQFEVKLDLLRFLFS